MIPLVEQAIWLRQSPPRGIAGSNSCFLRPRVRNRGRLSEADSPLRERARVGPEGNRKMLWGGRREMATSSLYLIDGVPAMPQPNDLSRSLVALDQNSTIIAVIELSQSSWLVAGMLPGIDRQPRKKLEPSPERLLGLL